MTTEIYTSPERRQFRFNDHVVCEGVIGIGPEQRVGRLVQVRKGAGQFKTDMLFIRRRDGTLCTFENVWLRHVGDKEFEKNFYLSNGRTPPATPDQQPNPADAPDVEYFIGDKWGEKGFVIENPKHMSPVQSFGIMVTSP